MPVPKRKRSRARRDSRFADKAMQVKAFTKCQNCQEILVPHVACQHCGFYKGVKVLKTKVDRVIKRTEVAQAAQARKQSQSTGASSENK